MDVIDIDDGLSLDPNLSANEYIPAMKLVKFPLEKGKKGAPSAPFIS